MIDYEIIAAFRAKRRRQMFIAVAVFPLLFLRLFRSSLDQLPFYNEDWFAILLIGFIVGCIVFSLVNWRCPQCNKYLGRDMQQKFCKKCGVQLDE